MKGFILFLAIALGALGFLGGIGYTLFLREFVIAVALTADAGMFAWLFARWYKTLPDDWPNKEGGLSHA